MPDLEIPIKGIVIGLSVAIPVGPMAILCIRQCLASGIRGGMTAGAGIAAADATYAAIAAFGLTAITSLLVENRQVIQFAGGIALGILGFRGLRSAHAGQASLSGIRVAAPGPAPFLSTFALTLANPMTILSFVAIFAGFGLASEGSATAAALLVAGVFAGSMLWWAVLSALVTALRSRLTARWLLRLNLFSAALLVVYGTVAIIAALR